MASSHTLSASSLDLFLRVRNAMRPTNVSSYLLPLFPPSPPLSSHHFHLPNSLKIASSLVYDRLTEAWPVREESRTFYSKKETQEKNKRHCQSRYDNNEPRRRLYSTLWSRMKESRRKWQEALRLAERLTGPRRAYKTSI